MPIAAARLRRSLLLSLALAVVAPFPALAADPVASPTATAEATAPDTASSSEPTTAPEPTVVPESTPAPEPTASPDPVPTDPPAPTEPPAPSEPPVPDPSPVPPPAVQTLDVNLYRTGAAVHQFKNTWCVPANAQKILNLINATTDRSYRTQLRYSRQIRRLNLYRYPTPGNDVRGWARFLDAHTGGEWHYTDRRFASRGVAIAAMVESIDRTGHPVGIVVGRGSHAWTVVGYRATITEGVPGWKIVGLYVSGSLRRDPFPSRYMTLAQFAVRYTRYHEATRRVIWEGKYVIVSE